MNADLGVLVAGVQALLDKIPQGLELARPARVYQTHLKLALMHLRRAGAVSTGEIPQLPSAGGGQP